MRGHLQFFLLLFHSFLDSESSNPLKCPSKCDCTLKTAQTSTKTTNIAPLSQQTAPTNMPSNITIECRTLLTKEEILEMVRQFVGRRVTVLRLNNGNLDTVEPLCCLYHLEQLNLANNRLQELDLIDTVPTLRRLNLHGNQMRAITRDMFRAFPSLELLNLSHNQIEAINSESFILWHLTELDLSNNRLDHINQHTFRYCVNLRRLNLSGNLLSIVRVGTFYFSSRLQWLNLANNQIVHLEQQAFETLTNILTLDLSDNPFDNVPTNQLNSLKKLETLLMDSNQFRTLDQSAFKRLTALRKVYLRNSTSLRLVLAGSFRELPQLEMVDLSASASLAFVSPAAFQSCPELKLLNVSNCDLRSISSGLKQSFKAPIIASDNTPLSCGCNFGRSADASLCPSTPCAEELYNWPRDTVHTVVGQTVTLYCVTKLSLSTTSWTGPDGKTIQNQNPPQAVADYQQLSNQVGSNAATHRHLRSRVETSSEYLRFDFVTMNDAGRYDCRLANSDQSASVTLSVSLPNIDLFVLDLDATDVTLAWNDTLRTRSPQIRAFLVYQQQRNDRIPTMPRIVHLPMQNPWFRYSIGHLRANTNYSFCLSFNHQFNESILQTCVHVTTPFDSGMSNALLGWTLLVILSTVCGCTCLVYLFRYLHRRFYIWQESKYRSRVAMSISGQSFLSSADSLQTNGGRNVTFENVPMSASMYDRRSASSSRGADSNRYRDMAL